MGDYIERGIRLLGKPRRCKKAQLQ